MRKGKEGCAPHKCTTRPRAPEDARAERPPASHAPLKGSEVAFDVDVVNLGWRGPALGQAAVVEVGCEGEEWRATDAAAAEDDLRVCIE